MVFMVCRSTEQLPCPADLRDLPLDFAPTLLHRVDKMRAAVHKLAPTVHVTSRASTGHGDCTRAPAMTTSFIELDDRELAHVSGGFLPLLGLLGAGGGLVGQILGGIGKKKAEKAEQIVKDAQAQAGAGSQQPPQGQMMGERAQVAPSDG
jgi:lactobin A/cerein 7B family class IIb bacteriocin